MPVDERIMMAMTRNPNLRGFQVHRDLAVLVLLIVGCALPFLSQPFHMDDNFYMDMARGISANPLHPYDRPYDFGGFHVTDIASHTHPPLQAYLLACVLHFAGEGGGKEWIYHAIAIMYPLLAVISFYYISALFVERPIWPALGLAVCPLVLVMEHTIMTDVPTLAFWLAAIACFLWAVELNRGSLYAASSLMMLGAVFMSYPAVSLVPLLAFYHIRKRGRPAGWIALLLAPACLAAWLGISAAHFGRLVVLDTLGYVQSRGALTLPVLGTKAIALLEYQGWLIVFPLFFLYALARGLRGRLLVLALLGGAFFARIVLPVDQYRTVDKVVFVIGLVTGIFVTLRMSALILGAFGKTSHAAVFGKSESRFLSLWYFGVAAYCLFLYTEGSARYILPLVPPILIVFFRGLEVAEVTEYRADHPPLLNTAMVASGSIVLSLAFGLFLSQADFEFARIYPRAAATFSRMTDGLDSYVAGEWGFRYYFTRVGAAPLPADETVMTGGSLIVTPKLAMPYGLPAGPDSMALPLSRLSFDLKTPFRTMDWHTPAGFYSTGWGLIPFSLSRQTVEILQIQQIGFMVERLPWARVESPPGEAPWPGYVAGRDRALAILARPDTRIVYPWTQRRPMDLKVAIGILNDGGATDDSVFRFAIVRADGQGRVLSRYEEALTSGMRAEVGIWRPVRMNLPASAGDGDTLEFRYSVLGNCRATGAFVQALLEPSKGSEVR